MELSLSGLLSLRQGLSQAHRHTVQVVTSSSKKWGGGGNHTSIQAATLLAPSRPASKALSVVLPRGLRFIFSTPSAASSSSPASPETGFYLGCCHSLVSSRNVGTSQCLLVISNTELYARLLPASGY